MKYRLKFIPALLSITAAFIACVATFFSKCSTLEIMVTTLIAMVAFWIIGKIVEAFATSRFVIEEEKEEEKEGDDKEKEEEEESDEEKEEDKSEDNAGKTSAE